MAGKNTLRLNLRVKFISVLILLSISPIIIISFLTYQSSISFFKKNIVASLTGIAYLKSKAIDAFIEDRVQEIEGIATIPDIVFNSNLLTGYMISQKKEAPKTNVSAEPVNINEGKLSIIKENKIEGSEEKQAQELLTQDIIEDPTPAPEEPIEVPRQESAQPAAVLKDDNIQEYPAYQNLNKTLSLILGRGEKFEELFLIDPSGTVRLSTHYEHEGKSASHNPYFTNGLKATFIQDIYVSGLTGKLSMVITVPVKDEIGKVIAILGARLNLETLHRLIKTEKGLGMTGETIVGKKVENEVVFMAPTRYDDEAALKRKVAIGSRFAFPLQEAAREREGSGFAIDYRGKETLAAWSYVSSLKWGVVAKMDAQEALRPVNNVRNMIALVALGLIVIAVILSVMISKGFVGPLQELTKAADDISRGDLNVKLNIKSKDEVGDLAESFERMVAAIRFLKEEKELDGHEEQ